MMMLIALCGRAGSGKSTVARYMVEHYGATRYSFAEPLKRLAMDLWDFSEEQVFGEVAIKETIDPRWGISPRTAMQRLGEGARQHLHKGIWTDALIERLKNQDGLCVIDDLRHRNEAETVYANGGHIIRLRYAGSKTSAAYSNHPSENEVDSISRMILAADLHLVRESLPDLFGAIDTILGTLGL